MNMNINDHQAETLIGLLAQLLEDDFNYYAHLAPILENLTEQFTN